MKQVTRIQTCDGVLHDTHGEGRRHLQKLLGSIVCPLSHRLHAASFAEKSKMLVEDEIGNLREIIRLVDDMGLEPSDNE